MRRLMLIIAFISAAVLSHAQYDDEYKMEIGAGIGMVSYLGDYNENLTKFAQPMASVIARRVLNPYMAFKANLSYGKLKGDAKGLDTFYPKEPVEFDNTLVDFGITYEYNFWPYGTGRDYRGAKRLTPCISLGLGCTAAKTPEKTEVTANIPVGIGVRYKVAKRVNLGLEWVMHFSLSDNLDGVVDPYIIQSKGAFKNKDCYSMLQLTLTYSFMPKCVTCNNDD